MAVRRVVPLVIAGALANPFPVLAQADCFVLSSDYEGQPMVLLEAAVAGLPIVTVRFGSVADAVPGDELHIVHQTVEGLAQGMRDYLDGAVRVSGLDAEEYNALALREFRAAIESDDESSAASLSSSVSSSSAAEISASGVTTTRAAKPVTTVGHTSVASTRDRRHRD